MRSVVTTVCISSFQTYSNLNSILVFLGLPDRGYFGHVSKWTMTPLRAIWFTTLTGIIPGLLDLASPIAANAIFALTAMALDLSYIIPIFLFVPIFAFFVLNNTVRADPSLFHLRRRFYRNHPEVMFKPGPFYMGDGWLGWSANIICIAWTLFVCVLFSLPTVLPVTPDNMNYASVITVGVVVLSGYVHPSFVQSTKLITIRVF